MGDTYYNEIKHNVFRDSSSAIRITNYNAVDELDTIKKELEDLRSNLNKDGELYTAIIELQNSIEKNNRKDIKTTVKKYIKEFSMPFFQKIASEALLSFLKCFM